MTRTCYRLEGPHISWEAFDDEFVILDLNNGRYFSCAGGAAALWGALIAGHDPAEITALLASDPTTASRVSDVFQSMMAAGLLRSAGTALPVGKEVITSLQAAQDDWRFEAFDDLAALLVADPIHESDHEAGWPHQPGKT